MPDYKTTDYCAICGESPDSATHLFVARGHTYVPRRGATGCTCPPSYHGHSVLHHVECALYGVGLTGREEAEANRRGMAATPPKALAGAGRVKVEERPGMPQFGVFLGLYLDEHGDMLAVVRLDHYGLYLKALHPSKVTPVTPEEEEAYKP